MCPASSRLFSVSPPGQPTARQPRKGVEDRLLDPSLAGDPQPPPGPAAQRQNQAEEITPHQPVANTPPRPPIRSLRTTFARAGPHRHGLRSRRPLLRRWLEFPPSRWGQRKSSFSPFEVPARNTSHVSSGDGCRRFRAYSPASFRPPGTGAAKRPRIRLKNRRSSIAISDANHDPYESASGGC
jgi:hypothetical protein